jgi:FtsH-binding integral membrane protein
MILAIVTALAFSVGLAIAALLRFVVLRRAIGKNAADWVAALVMLIVLVLGITLKLVFAPGSSDNSGIYAVGLACVFAFTFSKGILKAPAKPPVA